MSHNAIMEDLQDCVDDIGSDLRDTLEREQMCIFDSNLVARLENWSK